MSAKSNGIAQPNQRRYNQRQLASLVWQRDGGCHLRHFHPADCDGVHDGCHLVPKQTLKRAFHARTSAGRGIASSPGGSA